MQMKTIQIDFDVHKAIEAQRTGFDDEPNDVLRRLFKLKPRDKRPNLDINPDELSQSIETMLDGGWISKNVDLSAGTKVRMEYDGVTHMGEIVDGKWHVEGEDFKSPSGAAVYVVSKQRGQHTSVNGWNYWQVLDETKGKWVLLKDLRDRKKAS